MKKPTAKTKVSAAQQDHAQAVLGAYRPGLHLFKSDMRVRLTKRGRTALAEASAKKNMPTP
jgi:phosphate starvation-inducible protein PhoH